MKHLIVALTLLVGDVPCPDATEQFAGITCPRLEDAQLISTAQQSYMLPALMRRTNCVFVAFEGMRTGELPDFSVAGTMYSFIITDYEGYTMYVLQEKGEGWTA